MPYDASSVQPQSNLIEAQIMAEEVYAKHHMMPFLREGYATDFTESLDADGFDIRMGVEFLVQVALHKRVDISTMVGLLRRFFEAEEHPAQAAADAIYDLIDEGYAHWDQEDEKIIVRFQISKKIQDQLDLYQYPVPMVVPPQEVETNRDTGYFTIRNSLILKNNHHGEDICLDHINRVNAIPLAINADVSAFVKNRWKNIDRQKKDETVREFKDRQKAFNRFNRVSRQVIQELLGADRQFWLTHKVDKRGRTYCQGYHISYQSNDFSKALIEFADKEILNDT